MEPRHVYETPSIVNFHWSPKKRRELQKRVNRITEPIEEQTLEEVWETIKQRKEAKMDVTDVLSGLNLSKSYVRDIEQPSREETVLVTSTRKISPTKKKKLAGGQAHFINAEDLIEERVAVARSSPPRKSPKKSPRKAAKKKSAKKSAAKKAAANPLYSSPPRASPPRAAPAGLTQQNLEQKDWSFYADNEVLDKELELGKELLDKAISRVTKENLEKLATVTANEDDQALVDILTRLLDLVNDGEQSPATWDVNKERLSSSAAGLLHKMKNYAVLVEGNKVDGEQTAELKKAFIDTSASQALSTDFEPVREFLCEAFCLIDIIDELNGAAAEKQHRGDVNSMSAEKHRERYERASFPVDTSLQAFASPAPDVSRVGIDPAFVSPIPAKDTSHDLGGASVQKYVEVSHIQEHTEQPSRAANTTTVRRSPRKSYKSPKRQHAGDKSAILSQEEL